MKNILVPNHSVSNVSRIENHTIGIVPVQYIFCPVIFIRVSLLIFIHI